MSVPRRLGGGHSELMDAGVTLSLQPRHPTGFPSEDDKDSSDSPMPVAHSHPHSHSHSHSHTYTDALQSSSSTHIATNALQSLNLSAGYSPSCTASMPSPHTQLSCASTVTTPSTPSTSSSFSSCSPGLDSSYSSPMSQRFPPQQSSSTSASQTSGATATTFVSTFSSTSSASSSPIGSPLLARRNAARPMSGSSASAKFPSPFKSLKSGAASSQCAIVNETISSIMRDDSSVTSASSPSKSPGSPKHLYSPKPSPGVRPNVASPAPSSTSSAASAISYNNLPAIDRVHRYVVTGTLQQSLFGVVKLAFDRVLQQQVAIKISRRERAQQQQTRSGVSVLENVRREAAVMQYLHERSASAHVGKAAPDTRKSLYAEMFAHMTVSEPLNKPQSQTRDAFLATCSPSPSASTSGIVGGKKAKRMSSRATMHSRVQEEVAVERAYGEERMVDDDTAQSTAMGAPVESESESDSDMRSSTPSSVSSSRVSVVVSTPSSSNTAASSVYASPTHQQQRQQQPLPAGPLDATDLEGERYICKYVEELEDDFFHYLVTDFIPAGDLYSMLTSFPQHRLSEVQARGLFRQMVLGVKYLHLRNVAHLDMSLENMCLDSLDAVRIIDFGVAALHPFTPTSFQTSYFSFPSASSPISFPSSSSSPHASGGSSPSLPSFRAANCEPPCVPSPHRSFLCKPVKELYAKPGKIRYMSPELFQGLAWDAFANDVFSLGVILYSLLTGRPPFQQAESSDVWFHVIYSGQWLTPQIRKQPSAHVYTHLSEGALSLIDFILKPQEMRPTCEQILQHPWMQQQQDG